MQLRKIGIIACLVTGFAALAACDSLPDKDKKAAKAAKKSIDEAEKTVRDLKARHQQAVSAKDGTVFRPYAEREDWPGSFDKAEKALSEAGSVYDGPVKKLLDDDESAGAVKLRQHVKKISMLVNRALSNARHPGQRLTFLAEARKTAPAVRKEAAERAAAISAKNAELGQRLEQVKKDWPKKAKDIDGRFAVLKRKERQAGEYLSRVEAEFAKFDAENADPDLAVFADSAKLIGERKEERDKADAELRKRADTLYRSYSKTLIDMRVDCFVTVGRSTWDNYSDYNTEKTYTYPPSSVPCDTLDQYSKATGKLSGSDLKKLNVNPKANRSSSHDGSEFWIQDWNAKFFHKYAVVENGKKSETDWVKVDEDDFFEHEEHLGMDIVSKPLGLYEDEAYEEAAPPGMAYVGDDKYGEWKKDDSGHTFWHWYGQYMFFSHMLGGGSPYYYSRAEYRTWNRDYRGRRSYYGSANGKRRYGSRGTVTRKSPRFSQSRFSRSGGIRSAPASIRSAGRASRGGGPGGGGK